MVRILIAGASGQESRTLAEWAERRLAGQRIRSELVSVHSEQQFWERFSPGRFQGAVICFGDTKGFLCARRVWEADRSCRVVLIDDTDRYAIAGYRIHLRDFLLRPCEEKRFDTALDRLIEPY